MLRCLLKFQLLTYKSEVAEVQRIRELSLIVQLMVESSKKNLFFFFPEFLEQNVGSRVEHHRLTQAIS